MTRARLSLATTLLLFAQPALAAAPGLPLPHESTTTLLGSPLERTIPGWEQRMRIAADPWTRKISTICRTARIPCGLEESPADPIHGIEETPDHNDDFDVPSAGVPVRQILDTILARHPAYFWEFHDGVLLIRPKRGKEHRRLGRPVLSRRMHRFQRENYSGNLLFEVCQEAEVIKFKEPQETSLPMLVDSFPPTGRIAIDLEDTTVRDALVAIARADGQMGWKFAYDSEERAYTFRIVTWGRDVVLSPYWW